MDPGCGTVPVVQPGGGDGTGNKTEQQGSDSTASPANEDTCHRIQQHRTRTASGCCGYLPKPTKGTHNSIKAVTRKDDGCPDVGRTDDGYPMIPPEHISPQLDGRRSVGPVRLSDNHEVCEGSRHPRHCYARTVSSGSACYPHTYNANGDTHTHVEPIAHPTRISNGPGADIFDVENLGASEQVVLLVSGMDCSGCATNLSRALEGTPGVSRVQVNFIMGKVDFQLNTTVKSADEAIRAAERSTGFRCVRQGCDDQFIDLLIPRSAIAELRESDIPGLLEVHPLDKHTVRASYDPLVIGARALVDRMCQMSGGLAPPKGDTALLHGQKRLCDHFMKTILASALTVPVVVLAWGPVDVEEELKAQVSLVLASLAQLIAVPEFYIPSMTALVRNGALEMDMLVVISITAAYVYSVVAFVFRMVDEPLAIPEFFETSTLLITLILLGRLIASYARARAIQAVSLRSLQPTTALIVEDDNLREIDSRLLQLGDCFKLLPHCQVPTDGVIIQGHSEVDESMITGENLFVKKAPGMGVIAGTMNGSGSLTARLTRLPGKNTVSDIAGLVEEATKSRPRIQDLADRVASYFVPAVSGVAIAVFVIWTIVNLKVIQAPTNKAVAGAITYTVAVLAVSCPCALGLAVPMVLVVAAGIAARGGVVIKSAESIVRSRAVTDVVFDKTGTITETKLDVAAYETFTRDAHEALALTRALVRETDHPVSTAVNRLLKSMGVRAAVTSENRSIPGDGVLALHGDAVVKAGNPTWTLSEHHPAVAKAVRDGLTVMSVTSDDALIALFALRTRLRADARSVIEDLRRRNIAVHLVSGDQQAAVESVASEVGIPIENTAAQKSPTEKQSYVSALMAENKTVLFCGDGTNDAVAVAQADVGVQLGGSSLLSSAVTRGAADVVLLSGLSGLPHLLDISGSAYRRMVFNFVWSGVYNVVAILMAAGAFVHVRIPPAYAGLGELVSVLPVVLVATTILLHKPPPAA